VDTTQHAWDFCSHFSLEVKPELWSLLHEPLRLIWMMRLFYLGKNQMLYNYRRVVCCYLDSSLVGFSHWKCLLMKVPTSLAWKHLYSISSLWIWTKVANGNVVRTCNTHIEWRWNAELCLISLRNVESILILSAGVKAIVTHHSHCQLPNSVQIMYNKVGTRKCRPFCGYVSFIQLDLKYHRWF
jgi:hypothetical protein